MTEKSYIAIDLKSFYASVECMERGLDPMKTNLVVADESRTEKTICLAVSPSLKAYGIPGRPRLFEVVQKVREVNEKRRQQAPGGRLKGSSVLDGELKRDPALALANEIAPEHLEIVTEDPRALLPKVKNAGAVFLGEWSPEPLGDYLAGPDHVLPTSGTARFFSPLSVDSFLKTMSVIQYGRETLAPVKDEIITLAQSEKLTAHANSIRVRFEEN